MPNANQLDLITIGRSSVDLYGRQVGGRLEDMVSFNKYIGGSPTNIAAGAARLGLQSALITRVGDEHMGRFIREELEREGVDTRGVKTDPERLTALVLLGIRNDEDFPLIFYRENCADMALSVDDIDPDFIREARCVCATGTHLSHPDTRSAVLKALEIAREAGIRTALDIDYRPNLWGLAGHGEGASRYVESERVTATLQEVLGLFDLIVGTEEEFHIAGGSRSTIAALRSVRNLTKAALVCKRGPLGASAFEGKIPKSLDSGVSGRRFEVEVFNVLGAGDGFMAGLLKGWLTGEDWSKSLEIANACGAFAVSRHGCTPSYPSERELKYFLREGASEPALRRDSKLEQVHWATNRTTNRSQLRIVAMSDEDFANPLPSDVDMAEYKKLCLHAVRNLPRGSSNLGIICDNLSGKSALVDATGSNLWIGRPAISIDLKKFSFLEPIDNDFGRVCEWPRINTAIARLDGSLAGIPLKNSVARGALLVLSAAARRNSLELLIEFTGSWRNPLHVSTLAHEIYEAGINPDWWMIRPEDDWPSVDGVCATIRFDDHYSGDVLIRDGGAEPSRLAELIADVENSQAIRGFVLGADVGEDIDLDRTNGTIGQDEALTRLTEEFRTSFARYESALLS